MKSANKKRNQEARLRVERDIVCTLGLVLLATLISALLAGSFIHTMNVLMVYFLTVVIVARVTTGYLYGIVAAIAGVIGVNFFFTYPYSALNFSISGYPITFASMLIGSVVTSALTSRIKAQTTVARQREQQNQSLYELTNSLLCLRAPEQISQTAADYLGHTFGSNAAICLGNPRVARWFCHGGTPPEGTDAEAAWAAFDGCCETGGSTGLFDHAESLYLPLTTAQHCPIGVVQLCSGTGPVAFDDELGQVFVRLMVSQIAIALEYRRLEREQQQATIEAETEKMRGNLLRAISHDLRTPLTGIYGSSSVMLEKGALLGEEKCKQFLLDIRENAQWLIRMVENLLSVTRIGQGASNTLVKAPEAAEEIIGAAIANLRKSYPAAKIKVQVPDQLLMVPMDGTLIQQVLINLTENAIKYAGGPEPIQVSLKQCGDNAIFTVTDHGPGMPADRINSAFDGKPMLHADRGDSYRGMGIGLPICKTIVTAHGGIISAVNLKEGGCRFSFSLPL